VVHDDGRHVADVGADGVEHRPPRGQRGHDHVAVEDRALGEVDGVKGVTGIGSLNRV
jgi:hypothetical protein